MSDDQDNSLAKSAAIIGGGCLRDMALWLLPVVVLGGIGAALLSAGSETTESSYGSSSTKISGIGLVGSALISLAVAVFFGRGSIRQITRVARGEGGLLDLFTIRGSIIGLLITCAALVAAVVFLFLAFTGATI